MVIKYIAASILIIVPILWGIIMIPILDFLEKKIFIMTKKNSK